MTLARQFWLLLLLPITLALGAYGFIAHENRHRVLFGEASAELRNHATLVEAAIGGAVERGQLPLIHARMERLARADRILGLAAFEEGGKPILITEHIAGSTSELAALARRVLQNGEDVEERHELGGGPTLVRTVTFSPSSGGPAVIAIVVRDLRYLTAMARLLDRGLGITGLVLLGVTALIAGFVSRTTVGRPAGAIVAGVERVASGDLDAEVPEKGAEELVRLARAFNAMTIALRDARARAEHESTARAAVERKLQHAQALAAAGQVAASIGHEIGSPLNVILGRARRAAEQPGCPEPMKQELETIALQSERISRVVARLLDVARPPREAAKESDLAVVVSEVMAFLAPELRQRNVRARLDRSMEDARIALDPDQAFQVVFNLCLNAAQAQDEGGDLVIRVRARAGGARGDHSARVLLEVEDRGPGVPREAVDHIFEPFFTMKAEQGGSGLGLAIVSGIVREAGGTIEVVSGEEGTGACFRVALPRPPSLARPRAETSRRIS